MAQRYNPFDWFITYLDEKYQFIERKFESLSQNSVRDEFELQDVDLDEFEKILSGG